MMSSTGLSALPRCSTSISAYLSDTPLRMDCTYECLINGEEDDVYYHDRFYCTIQGEDEFIVEFDVFDVGNDTDRFEHDEIKI